MCTDFTMPYALIVYQNRKSWRSNNFFTFHAQLAFTLNFIFHDSSLQTICNECPLLITTTTLINCLSFLCTINISVFHTILTFHTFLKDRLCGLVVIVPGYRSRDPEFDSQCYQIFSQVMGLERGPFSLVRIIEELLEWKSSSSGCRKSRITAMGTRCADHMIPSIHKIWH
jgi:hypothetical protein